jgi:ferredoxin
MARKQSSIEGRSIPSGPEVVETPVVMIGVVMIYVSGLRCGLCIQSCKTGNINLDRGQLYNLYV